MPEKDLFGHFLDAQEAVYDSVLVELAAGDKRGHWMWFVFPQIAGLGMSAMSKRYALSSVQEARDYFAHPILGQRLLQCCALLLSHGNSPAQAVLGEIDALKLRSSMTLFRLAAPECPLFGQVLDVFYAGQPDTRTLELVGSV